ncbi:MAG: 30S ribosomal protein S6 [Candidatus Xiphinematobacter sp.]|nr:MAG: 30S ribosomal protein S6 [Candidatus Xiphinematobacter sp.]
MRKEKKNTSVNTRRYEGLFALDTQGREEGSKEIIERIENALVAEGTSVLQVQRLEKHELAYEHKRLKTAYYVSFVFDANPSLIERLRQRFKLDEEIVLQQYCSTL